MKCGSVFFFGYRKIVHAHMYIHMCACVLTYISIFVYSYKYVCVSHHIYDDCDAKRRFRGRWLDITSPKIYTAVCNFLSCPYSRYMLMAQTYSYKITIWSRLWISRRGCSIAATDIRFGSHDNIPSASQYTHCQSAEKKVAILPADAYQFLGPLLITLFNF